MGFRVLLGREDFPRWVVLLGGFLVASVLGVVDYYTGHDLVLASLYVLPIGLVAWYAGPLLGLYTVAVSGVIWLTADVADGQASPVLVLALNTGIRLALFVIIVFVLATLHKAMRHLEEMSRFDGLTGAYRSAYLYDALGKEIERLKRYGHPLTLVYLDLDGFKGVNDRFGHLVGDKVLRLVAESARTRLRKTDLVARMGGDEFAFLCPETDEPAARAVVGEVIRRLDEEMRQGGWPVTFSVGVVTCHDASATGEVVIRTADSLMYTVKLGPKNGIEYASLGRPLLKGVSDRENRPVESSNG